MENCNLLVMQLFISALLKTYVQRKVVLEQSHVLDPKPQSSSHSTPMPKIENSPMNIPLDTDFTAVYARKETQKERLLLPSVLAALFWLCRNIQQQLETTLSPGFIKTSGVYNSVTHFKETGLDMLERCRHISRVHQIRTIYRNMAAGLIRITDSNAWNGNHSNSTRSKKHMTEKRGIQRHRKTEREMRTKHGTLHCTLFPDEMQQKQFYCLPGCTMNGSDNFSIITLEIKFE
jgi:hypothetical protein